MPRPLDERQSLEAERTELLAQIAADQRESRQLPLGIGRGATSCRGGSGGRRYGSP